MNRSAAVLRFHLSGGARVAARNAIATIGLIIIVLGSAPDPWAWLRFLSLGVAANGVGSGPLMGLTLIAFGLAIHALRWDSMTRLAERLRGLPAPALAGALVAAMLVVDAMRFEGIAPFIYFRF